MSKTEKAVTDSRTAASETPTEETRKVYIKELKSAWLVMFSERNKGQHYTAVQFDKSTRTLSQVEQWIIANPKLQLVNQ